MTPVLNFTILKANAKRRTFTARAVAEEPDNAGECFDYDSSVQHFRDWSAEAQAATGGKSCGNLRAMHNRVAAGHLTSIDFNDAEKAIDVECKVTDPVEWEKLESGTYAGLSIGGAYARKWSDTIDGKQVTRYEAKPSEISLVDKPCVRSAKIFSLTKRDGTLTNVAFRDPAEHDYFQHAREAARLRKINSWEHQMFEIRKVVEAAGFTKGQSRAILEAVQHEDGADAGLRKLLGDEIGGELAKAMAAQAAPNSADHELAKAEATAKPVNDALDAGFSSLIKSTLAAPGRSFDPFANMRD